MGAQKLLKFLTYLTTTSVTMISCKCRFPKIAEFIAIRKIKYRFLSERMFILISS
jgi:hypothetical protein